MNFNSKLSSNNISIPSHLLWRSTLGSCASWSGSSSRGMVLNSHSNEPGKSVENNNTKSLIRHIASDRRMFYLPCSLRDRLIASDSVRDCKKKNTNQSDNSHRTIKRSHKHNRKNMQLLSHPRIVNAVSQNRYSSEGIACMDLDRGHDESAPYDSPCRYLLVGSGGSDCSIALYDLSYFGSDSCLYQQKSQSTLNTTSLGKVPMAAVTHRPIARSVRHIESIDNQNSGAVPSGHRYPLLGVNWYPADQGSFVSASISGEILVWDAEAFVPVYATATHVYSGSSSLNNEVRKSVAPLQCMDLPKSPTACPHGRALLALGLGGGDGRGVIQLCDAFGGGSATHELVGHNDGVNAVAWDPKHPFRLASGGDDGTVRLWDIRKAGRNACLGVLDRNFGYSDVGYGDAMSPPSKRQRASINHGRSMEGVHSHACSVTAIAFAPGGQEFVSSGLDGSLQLWDLRPDSCYVSSITARVGNKKSVTERGGLDPAVAVGGRLCPFVFGSGARESLKQTKRQRSRKSNASSLAVVQPGSRNTAMVYSTTNGNAIAGYWLFGNRGKEPEGTPDILLQGHLDDITCLNPVVGAWDNLGVGCHKDNSNPRLLSAGKDGMVLSWGTPAHEVSDRELNSLDNGEYSGNRSNMMTILKRQRQHHIDRLNRQYRDGLISGREWHEISHDDGGAGIHEVDVDSW